MSEALQDSGRWRPTDSFGNRLAVIRNELGLTQQQAAERCGLDDGSWSNWERGANPREKERVVYKIVRGLHVDREWLMWGGELTPPSNIWYTTEDETAGQPRLYALGAVRLPGIS